MKSKEYMITGAMLILITYTLSLSIVSQAFSAEQTSTTLSNSGTIQIQTTQGIGIYSNQQCTTEQLSITWGTLEPGGNQSVICYIKNEGNTETVFSMQTSNWEPSNAADYITLSWDYDGQAINPEDTVEITFTLSVSPEITGITSFNFDITLIGST
ncbi:MAG: hypothetical protein JW702_07270 [Clostridiales bacterium]|nr:hypothetical protein [Clostridiales bacterium]